MHRLFLILLLLLSAASASAQRLDLFLARSYFADLHDSKEYLPYERILSYYDFITDSVAPDTMINGQKAWFLYIRYPANTTELGIRVLSPAPEFVFATKGDIETEDFMEHYRKNKNLWFDPAIRLEYGTLTTNGKFVADGLIAENDNSSEPIPLPDGKRNNALFRALNRDSYPAGTYRLTLIMEKSAAAKNSGSFLMQLGCVPGLRNVLVTRNPAVAAEW